MNYLMKDAIFDDTKKYRYSLTRVWNPKAGKVTFILLNPSTADALEDDPTVKKCYGFSNRWGYGAMEIVNLFALRATDPSELKNVNDPVGKDNDEYIIKAVESADLVILGWGNECSFSTRDIKLLKKIAKYNPHCLYINKSGKPKHPLYASYSLKPVEYS